MRAVITAGGTSEPIDDVRVVTNLSTGRFGAALADELVSRGVEVHLLAGRGLASHPEWLDPRVRVTPFGSFADLARVLDDALTPPPDLVLMAAAVSDYSPVPVEGKLSSSAEDLTIHLRRNPKLLATLRERCGPACTLVGFKLLSGVPRERLIAVASAQLASARLDRCVANDLAELSGASHPIVLVGADGTTERIEGSKAEVARALVDRLVPPAPSLAATCAALGLEVTADGPGVAHLRSVVGVPGSAARGRALLERDDGGWSLTGPGPALLAEWHRARAGAPEGARPVLVGGRVVGAWTTATRRGVEAMRLLVAPGEEEAAGRVLDRWSADGRRVLAGDDDERRRLAERGWRTEDEDEHGSLHLPPSLRDDWIAAASVCLQDLQTGRILLGRRKTRLWHGYWAFPGGRLEPGEGPLAGGLRELLEETGIAPDGFRTVRTLDVFVGDRPGFRVTNLRLETLGAPEPRETDELAARWVTPAEARSLNPMAAGTRRILLGS